MIFTIVFIILLLERISELMIAKRNEKWMLRHGAVEFGTEHYGVIVAHHCMFLMCFALEVLYFDKSISQFWMIIVPILLIAQFIRYWAILSLGNYWNTKVIIIPGTYIEVKGPYKFLKHPNYLIVIIEILFIPLLFKAYATAIVFSILNFIVIETRIRVEEEALELYPNYHELFFNKSRFVPKLANRLTNHRDTD
ncbi:isoprenylcysteine carboxyl methyltransferase family protein [Metabacillus malikii]|uniref:Methyltransferase n=1 Tax=Metabacillus malikii TaxID=1504265 RepID=A0ABT9Z987_9BACI|nr:isoprenylcysteine carboxylmethyltransferase family protein [Metabacillus malikii]MDQ0228821.1 methyltransferase [Metabacillus malikii]